MIFIETLEDLDWLQTVHNISVRSAGYTCAILYGNEDSPSKVELFAKNHYKSKPTVYEADENGILRLKEFGTKPKQLPLEE